MVELVVVGIVVVVVGKVVVVVEVLVTTFEQQHEYTKLKLLLPPI